MFFFHLQPCYFNTFPLQLTVRDPKPKDVTSVCAIEWNRDDGTGFERLSSRKRSFERRHFQAGRKAGENQFGSNRFQVRLAEANVRRHWITENAHATFWMKSRCLWRTYANIFAVVPYMQFMHICNNHVDQSICYICYAKSLWYYVRCFFQMLLL